VPQAPHQPYWCQVSMGPPSSQALEPIANVRSRTWAIRRRGFWVAAILLVHVALVTWTSLQSSPNFNEPAHTAAGIYSLKFSRFEVYRVNPPLPRMIAALPAVAIGLTANWLPAASGVLSDRPEFAIGRSLFTQNEPEQVFRAIALGRLMLLPLSLLGAWTCYRWATSA
jgi:hypothetical protein